MPAGQENSTPHELEVVRRQRAKWAFLGLALAFGCIIVAGVSLCSSLLPGALR